MFCEQGTSSRPSRRAKPCIDRLVDKFVFRSLEEAEEIVKDGDFIAVIPPDGSDKEDVDDKKVNANQDVVEVAGLLNVVSASQDDEACVDEPPALEVPQWRVHHKGKEFPEGDRLMTLSETFPALKELSPLHLFQLYFTRDVATMISVETVRYARQCGDMVFTVDVEEIDRFIMILLYTSYVHLPRQSLYWSRDFDCALQIPSQAMSRNRFTEIKKYLHFCDNDFIDVGSNPFAKIQPLIDHLNTSLLQFGFLAKPLAVDEAMVAYAGRHPTKQYMKAKPIKWGYKFWVLSDNMGYPYHISPYGGRRSAVARKTPLGYSVVMQMVDVVDKASSLANHTIFMDNFFTSCDLLRELGDRNLRASGIIRSDRLRNIPLKPDSQLKVRGDYHSLSDGRIRLIRLHDSKVVTLATNFDTVEPLHQTSRRSKAAPKAIYKIPHAFKTYNEFMGAVDLTNRFVSDYKVNIAGKKWYWAIFIHCITMMRVAAWRLSAHIHHGRTPLDQLEFLRKIVQDMMTSSRKERPTPGPKGRHLAQQAIHLQIPAGKQGRCRVCHKNCRNVCQSCNVMLHNRCSAQFKHF
jgi:hypothetical protein